MIKPTVGRVVWFYRYATGQGHKGPMAAHVCKVHSDSCINVMLIEEDGCCCGMTSIPLIQDGEECPASDYCCWMPYQKGQAAKAEELEKKLSS